MGSFAATLFNFMLGWLRNLVSGLWDLTKSQQTRDMLAWLGEHWLTLVLLLAIGGLVVDYLVWLIRWRPYYVWISRLRRLFGRNKAEEASRTPDYPAYEPRQTAYPLPQTETWREAETAWQTETQPYAQAEQPAYEQQTYQQEASYGEPVDYAAYQRPAPETAGYTMPYTRETENEYTPAENAWQEPEPPAEFGEPDASEPVHPGLTPSVLEEKMGWSAAPSPRKRRSQRSQRVTPQPLDWVRSGISQVAQKIDFIGRDQDETEEYAYTPPPPAVDKRQAFHAPVYPRGWDEAQQQGEQEE